MRVGESKQRDVGKRRARIGHNAMDYLHVAPGDIIELKGSKTSCAIVWPSDEDEKNPDSIRLDGQTRKNIGTALGDVVYVKKVIMHGILLSNFQLGFNFPIFFK